MKKENTKLVQIGRLISEMRRRANLTQEDLAKVIKSTQSVIARIESGEQNLTTDMLEKISEALNGSIVNVSSGSLNLKIEGGRKLSGSVVVKSSKNSAVGLLCASILNKNRTLLKNMPKIEEVHRIVEVLKSIGFGVRWIESDLEIKPPQKIDLGNIDKESATKTRSIIMMIGPLIHHFKTFNLPQAGGCKLGSRTVKPHFFALEKFGVNIKATTDSYEVKNSKLRPADIVLYESGDTVTENAIMAAALIPGKTIIRFASANYQVQDLCYYLKSLGVKIEGVGTTTLTIEGVAEIDQAVEYAVSEDPIEAMFFIAVAIVTNSSIKIVRAPIDFLFVELLKLEKMGFKYRLSKTYKGSNGEVNLVDIETKPSKLTALEEKIESRPYPGLNIDNLPFFAVIATVAKGETFIHDWVFEKRAIYYKELEKLGANTLLADPHRFYVTGPTKLKATEAICPPALRPAVIMLVGMLGAEGTSILRNVYSINRGYEDLASRLNALGAKVTVFRD